MRSPRSISKHHTRDEKLEKKRAKKRAGNASAADGQIFMVYDVLLAGSALSMLDHINVTYYCYTTQRSSLSAWLAWRDPHFRPI